MNARCQAENLIVEQWPLWAAESESKQLKSSSFRVPSNKENRLVTNDHWPAMNLIHEESWLAFVSLFPFTNFSPGSLIAFVHHFSFRKKCLEHIFPDSRLRPTTPGNRYCSFYKKSFLVISEVVWQEMFKLRTSRFELLTSQQLL